MKTSVILTCYNHEKSVIHALNSVLKNQIQDTELIICDDASQDKSAIAVKSWIDANRNAFERVIFIQHDKNYGVTQSLNELISECRGELISPLASDDYYLDGGILARHQALRNHPKWLGAFSDGIAVGFNDELYSASILDSSKISPGSLNAFNIKTTVLQKWIEPMNLQFWRNTAFKSHGGEFEFNNQIYCEDLNFALWALAQSAFGYIDSKCYAYRCRSWPQPSDVHESKAIKNKKLNDMASCYKLYSNKYPDYISEYMNNKSQYLISLGNKDDEHTYHYLRKIIYGPVKPHKKLLLKIKDALFWPVKRLNGDFRWWFINWKHRLNKNTSQVTF